MNLIISGDIVDSKKIKKEERNILISELKLLLPKGTEFYRGDSFQGEYNEIENAFLNALSLKLSIRNSPKNKSKQRWDIRIALGIGEIENPASSISESDGTAFRNSGSLLDSMGSLNEIRIGCSKNPFKRELEIELAFVNHIISSWTPFQEETILLQLQGNSQKQIAEILGINQSSINRRLKASNWNLIQLFNRRFKEIISELK